MKHFLNLIDLTADELCGLLSEAARLKAGHARGLPARSLSGKVVALVFEIAKVVPEVVPLVPPLMPVSVMLLVLSEIVVLYPTPAHLAVKLTTFEAGDAETLRLPTVALE